jgi:ribonuclease P protein component
VGRAGKSRRGSEASAECGKSNCVRWLLPGDLDLSADLGYVYRFSASTIRTVLESSWVSRRIVPGTSAASRPTGFARAWKRSGDAKHSAGAVRRDASVSPLSCQASTQAPDGETGFGFSRRQRLARGSDIQNVIREGRRVRTTYLDVRVLASPLGYSRVGIVVPRYKQSAVRRNRVKRWLRELVRLELLPALRATAPCDIAIRSRPNAYDARLTELHEDIRLLARQARVGPA